LESICVTLYNVWVELDKGDGSPGSVYSRKFTSISKVIDVSRGFKNVVAEMLGNFDQSDPQLVADQFDDQIVSISYGGFAISDGEIYFPR